MNPELIAGLCGYALALLTVYGVYTVNRRAVHVDVPAMLHSAEVGISRDVKLAEGEAAKIAAEIKKAL